MTRKQLRVLISAGVFSAALLRGDAYAKEGYKDPAPANSKDMPSVETSTSTPTTAETTTKKPKAAKSVEKIEKKVSSGGCAGAGGCGGH